MFTSYALSCEMNSPNLEAPTEYMFLGTRPFDAELPNSCAEARAVATGKGWRKSFDTFDSLTLDS